ncbi:MAG: XrtA/PEP-CTERM system TPR-repeat protein PrsT [Candidatus Competibacterales bacterium]
MKPFNTRHLLHRLSPLVAVAVLALLIAPPAWSDRSDRYLAEAREYLQEGEVSAAVIQLKNALQSNPANVEARLLLGEVYLRTGETQGAVKELTRAKELGAPRDQWLETLGRALLIANDPQQLLEAITVAPADPPPLQGEALALRGNALLLQGNIGEAQGQFDQSLALAADNYNALLGKGRLAVVEDDLEQAVAWVDRAIAQDDRRVEGWLLKGRFEQGRGEHAQALDAYSRSLELVPNNPQALLSRAESALVLGDDDLALADVEAAERRLRGGSPKGFFIRGRVLLKRGELEAAQGDFQAVLRQLPNHRPSQLLLAVIHYNQDELTLAINYLEPFVRAAPGYLPGRKLLAASYLKSREPQQAISLLEPIVDSAADDPQLLALMGNAYLQAGDYQQGSQFLEQATALVPDVSAIRTQLALSKLAEGRTEEALGELQSAIDLGQDLVQTDYLLVVAQMRAGDTEAALVAAEQLVAKAPESAQAHNLLGLVHIARQDYDRARQAFTQSLAVDETSVGGHLNLARLAVLEDDPAAANGELLQALERDEDNAVTLLALASLAERQGDREAQWRWQEEAWNRTQERRAGLGLVRLALAANANDRAVTVARQMQIENPDDPTILRALGTAQLATGDLDDAIFTLRRAATRGQDGADLWHLIARAYLSSRNAVGAREALDRALRIDGDYGPAVALKARMLTGEGSYREAQPLVEQLLGLPNFAPQGHQLAGEIHYRQGEFAAAAEDFGRAYGLVPNTLSAMGLSNARRQQGDGDGAAEVLQDWLSRSPNDARARLQLAMVLDYFGDGDAAAKEYQNLIDSRPDNPVVLNNLAWREAELGRLDRALTLAERARELAPQRPEIGDTLGWILVQRGEVERGLVVLQQAAVEGPQFPDIHYHLAVAYHRAGRHREALETLNRLLSEEPAFDNLADAKALQEELRSQL